MPLTGPLPKPRDQIRHRIKPAHEWTDVPDIPFDDAPPLPRSPGRKKPRPPEPPRPLGQAGRATWERAWIESYVKPDADALLQLCEQQDERVGLRVRVLRDNDWHDRQALRTLDEQVSKGVRRLGLDEANAHPTQWPASTRTWWKAVSSMPHCALWTDTDWQYALATAVLVAAFHNGELRYAGEIRVRERAMGTSHDARRALRIRYVSPEDGEETAPHASIIAMDGYRQMLGESE